LSAWPIKESGIAANHMAKLEKETFAKLQQVSVIVSDWKLLLHYEHLLFALIQFLGQQDAEETGDVWIFCLMKFHK